MELETLYEIYKQHPVVTTDSRDCPQGSLFFALKGETFNGNAFAGKALEQGCAYAVVDDETVVPQGDERYILVSDVLKTLQDLAHYHREPSDYDNSSTLMQNIRRNLLLQPAETFETQGILLQLLSRFLKQAVHIHNITDSRIWKSIRYIRKNMDKDIDLETLAKIVDPDFGIITNVGKAHLEGFGSFEGVIKTKGELYDYLRAKHGTVFLDHDNIYLKNIADGLHQIFYGAPCDEVLSVEGELIDCTPYLRFKWHPAGGEWQEVNTQRIGSYNLKNAMAAAVIGRTFGVSVEDINEAISGYVPTNNRSQLVETADNKLVVDAYNANPTSMKAAIENFSLMKADKKMAILGDMKELGPTSWEEHQKMVDLLVEAGFNHVWLVGKEFKATHHPFRTFDDVEQVKEALAIKKPKGYHILIKGSHSTKLYELPDLL